ncbi:MAG TPA: DUF1552 domain-containing protein, partial [Pseudomonadota bacterium]|nr:DUF1552 domain-containing protein [Pseudomonadota bacterium]
MTIRQVVAVSDTSALTVAPGGEAIADPRLGLRPSAPGAVSGDLRRLQDRVGAEGRARLEQHLTGVRELETRLARLQEDPPDLEACL